jgi:hypothetical protein
MPQQMMWNVVERTYRGQAPDGTVVTVDEDAMNLALQKAGKTVFETEWWLDALAPVLQHWGLAGASSIDLATNVPRLHFALGEQKIEEKKGPTEPQFPSGSLLTRLSDQLSSKDLPNDPPTGKGK